VRKRLSILLLALCGLLFVNGCTISRETFEKDAKEFAQKQGATLPQFEKAADPEGRIAKLAQKLLQDDQVRNAIYEEAVEERTAWSSKRIMEGNWYGKFSSRGLSRLSLSEKQYFLALAKDIILSTPKEECATGNLSFQIAASKVASSQMEQFLELQESAVKLGSVNRTRKKRPTKTEIFVAATALAAKARERYSDEELGTLILPIMEKGKSGICAFGPPLINLILELDPKYQQILIDELIK